VAKTGARPGSAGTPADLVLGSWRRTLVAASVILLAFAGVIAAATTFGDLRHANFPGHPYPPPGFYRNPFSGSDDLVNASLAQQVKTDLMRDGQIELEAFATGDASMLALSDTGNRLIRLQQLVQQNNAQGILQRELNRLDKVVVGHLQDPRQPSIDWCVSEQGMTTVTDLAKSNGQTLRTQRFRFDSRFWLVKSGDHYLIADAELSTQPSAGG
jgi:hypothetical protein